MALGLFTDLYELSMLRAYWELGIDEVAVFSLFVRQLPPQRNYLIACGIDDLLDQLEGLRFDADDLDYLSTQDFPDPLLKQLADFRFEGDVYAMPEGTPFFANEPIAEFVAPIGQAQVIETLAINQVGFPTLIASKTARMVSAAQGRSVVDFGGRRAHGLDAAIKGARAAYAGGAMATSSVIAGKTYGIPITGTMAHSFVQAYEHEIDAFRDFAKVYPDTVLLVDTYDTLEGVRKVIALARELGDAFKVRAVRIDSGDLAVLSREARALLDAAGLQSVRVFASGGLNEQRIGELVADDAAIDAFGVGTDLIVSTDAPAFDIVYKLTEYGGAGRMKLSSGKRTLPGRKQVFRELRDGVTQRDVIARRDETLPGTPLLQQVMKTGVRLSPPEPLSQIQARCREEVARLRPELRELSHVEPPFEAEVSPALLELERKIAKAVVEP
jgi:nicotinate phosphoribosyltransferase